MGETTTESGKQLDKWNVNSHFESTFLYSSAV